MKGLIKHSLVLAAVLLTGCVSYSQHELPAVQTWPPTANAPAQKPLATNTRVASRSTGRLTAYSSQSKASAGNLSSGLKRPSSVWSAPDGSTGFVCR